MGKTVRIVVLTLVAAVIVAVLVALALIYTGAYNVAATESHWAATRWAFNTLMERSVEARAGEVTGQPPTDAAALFHGFEHYHEICVQCHGAPGMDRGELGQGIQPEPPRLDEEAEDWSDAELFWITKYGIRLAGMPAFGRTHSDDEIWGIVGFLRQMQTMTAEEYADRVRALEAETGGGEEGRQDTSPSATPTRPGRRPTSTDRGDSTVPNGSPASALQGGG